MADQNQPPKFPVNEKERDLIIGAFKDNEYLLKAIRSLLFGFDVSDDDKKLIKDTFANNELKNAFRKRIYPILDNTMPIGQISDFWLGTESQTFGAQRDTIYQAYQIKMIVQKLLDAAIALLNDPESTKIDLSVPLIEADPLMCGLMARNLYIKSIENGLLTIKLTAEQKIDTPADTKIKQLLDSSK